MRVIFFSITKRKYSGVPAQYTAGCSCEHQAYKAKKNIAWDHIDLQCVLINPETDILTQCSRQFSDQRRGAAASSCPKMKIPRNIQTLPKMEMWRRERLVFLAVWLSNLSCIKVCVPPVPRLPVRRQHEGGRWAVTLLP